MSSGKRTVGRSVRAAPDNLLTRSLNTARPSLLIRSFDRQWRVTADRYDAQRMRVYSVERGKLTHRVKV